MSDPLELLKHQITDGNAIHNFIKNSKLQGGERKSLAVWSSRKELLKDYWASFRERHLDLQLHLEELKDRTYFKENQYLQVEESYIEALSLLNESITRESTPAAPAPAIHTSHNVFQTLPKIPLPNFDGDQLKWDSFKEIFKARVVNADYDPVIKLQQLLSCLQGEAARRLGSLELTTANFRVAWDNLSRRYDNKRIRLSTHISRLVSAPSVNTKMSGDITRLLDTFEESIRALRGLEQPVDHWDAWFVQLIVSKLDYTTRTDWEKSREADDDFSTYKQLAEFLENRARTQDAARASSGSSQSSNKPQGSSSNSSKKSNVSAHATSAGATRSPPNCSQCNGEPHYISKCPKFLQMNVSQRRALISPTSDYCFNCLGPGHRAEKCNSKFTCRTCKSRHHTLLHVDRTSTGNNRPTGSTDSAQQQQATQQQQQSPQQQSSSEKSNVSVNTVSVGGRVLMATALVILDSGVNQMTVRALIDPAADESFITEHVAQSLQLRRSSVTTTLTGVGGEEATPPKSLVSLTLKSLQDPQFSFNFSALVLNKLTNLLPSKQVHQYNWPHIQGLQLADPDFHTPARIDCILSAEVYAVILRTGLHRGTYPSPVAQETVFGWVLLGPVKTSTACSSRVTCNVIQHNDSLNLQLQKFWEVEEPQKSSILSPEEAECEAHFLATHQRDSTGRFVLRLPFIQPPELPGSLDIARSRFFGCEKNLQRDLQFQTSYNAFIDEYENLGHMETVPIYQLHREKVCYIPHHGVFKADSGKLRVVFNGSQSSKNGKSLNDYLHVGPKLQAELPSVLTRWRFFKYVFTADIVKMFRQFRINSEDTDWLRIFWRSSSDKPLQTYRLTTVTYGTACAPYQAIRCLKQLAADERHRFPRGASIIDLHSYVDDNLGGDHDINATIEARDELIQILASAGMQLDKWSANDPQLLAGLNSATNVEHTFEEAVSTLGLKWKPQQDCFQFKVSAKATSHVITKRTMLSEIASLFDPLGWLSPVIIRAKVYIQELWIRRKDWDDPVDDDLQEEWLTFKQQLPDIEIISIPRWIFTSRTSRWELHGFSDASERAYAAAIYLVTYDIDSNHSSLILAKTKVAPVKKLSIPRLELCGAQLLSRTISYIRQQLLEQPSQVFCWSDSQVVLAWLKGHSSRWNNFVGNRTSEIISLNPDAVWNHVNTHQNPADIASRGATPAQLNESTLWWHGPTWLQQGPASWPQTRLPETTDCEAKNNTKIFQSSIKDTSIYDWFSRYSSLAKLTRQISYLYRWKHNAHLKPGEEKLSSPSVKNYTEARAALIRVTQHHLFKGDIQAIARHGAVDKSSHLAEFSPIISSDNILRVGGRLQNLQAGTFDEVHPAIIPKRSTLAKLLIHDAHIRTLHGGAQLVQSTLRRRYWIIHDRSQIRHFIKNCTKCLRFQGRPQHQFMAPLPAVRLQPSRPFTYTGVDYAGPFNIRASKGRGHTTFKGYVSIFVCMVTRAVHLELVSDYTTKTFLAAFRRFISRRGMCQSVYSDHGTTFQGACNEIHKLFAINSAFIKEVTTTLKAEGIQWTFIPPKAPHFGGLWESKVKSFKHHLRRVADNSTMTYEEFSTLITQIEACINSRPLSPLTGDPNDICALTPGHFLIGGPINMLPSPYSPHDEPSRTPRERWLLIQKLLGDFWRRWRLEVLQDLQKRSKWLEHTKDLQVDNIVIIKDDLNPPANWSLGRVIQCHPGPDGLTRVVTLKTATTTLRRPITKLILLPANAEATSHHITVKFQG